LPQVLLLERCEQARVLFTAELGSLDQMAVNIQRHLDVFVANEFLKRFRFVRFAISAEA
jgi:hypothetical protein